MRRLVTWAVACGALMTAAWLPAAGGSPKPEVQTREAPPLKTHLVFLAGTAISAGASTSGYLVVDNVAKAPIPITHACDGTPTFSVVLAKPGSSEWVGTAGPVCPTSTIRPGVHRYPFTVRGSYSDCTPSSTTSNAPGLPLCLQPGDRPPALPVGYYKATMQTVSSVPPTRTVAIRVIAPRPNPLAYRQAPNATIVAVPDLATLRGAARRLAVANGDAAIHNGYVILTTRQQAAAPDIVNSDQPVYEIVLQGHFTCGSCSIPPGARRPTGTVLTASIDRAALQSLDFGLVRSLPTVLMGEPVYRFSF